ncbi:MAG: hypothetical protein Q4F72_04730 [Desulfovibrionaceae bacterium]|nr:hypothetical protein [Desulfovibrionaceae bacterium]
MKIREQGLLDAYSETLGAGIVKTLLTGGSEHMLASVTASLMAKVTGTDVTGTRKGGRVLVGLPRVVAVDGSITETYLKVLKEERRRNLDAGNGVRISQSRGLRDACWQQAASRLSREASGRGRAKRTLSEEELRELENAAALEVFKKYTKSFVDGRARVRHPGLRSCESLDVLQKSLEAKGLTCTWNKAAGSALLTYDASRMSRSQFMQAVLPLAHYLKACAA